MFPQATRLSLNTVRIEVFSQDTDQFLSNGSGFLCRHNDNLFLVTNWHIVSGRHAITNEPLHFSGALPGKLKCSAYHATPIEGAEEGTVQTGGVTLEINLFLNGYNNWIEHQTVGNKIDVVAIPISEPDDGMQVPAFELDEENIDSSRIKVMGDVFIIGYPLSRKETNNMFPIYKSGTIASEPEIHDAEPRFYVDSKTKPGMSGSPVVYVNTEPPYTDGSTIRIPKETITLIGVYAGRDGIATTEYEAELGRVWPIKECLLTLLKK